MNPLQLANLVNPNPNLNSSKTEYNLIDVGDVEENSKMVGDEIVEKIKEVYLDNEVLDDPDKIKAQIKIDLLKIYYDDPGNKKVNEDKKNKICKKWYVALKGRNDIIMKKMTTLMRNPEKTAGGGKNDSNLSNLSNLSKLFGTNADAGPPNQIDKTENESVNANNQENDSKNAALFEKYLKYKSDLLGQENYENKPFFKSATVSDVYDLHNKIITKVLCNYAIINRDELVKILNIIILGENQSTVNESIYGLFIKKIEQLSDSKYGGQSALTKKYNTKLQNEGKSKPVTEELQENSIFGGSGDSIKLPKDSPSATNWDKIDARVESETAAFIKSKLENPVISNAIKEAFKEVFMQFNCDCLDVVDDKNKIMTELLNKELHRILETLCRNIPNESAAFILQSYIIRNFLPFVDLLVKVLEKDTNFIDAFILEYGSFASDLLNNDAIKLVPPEVNRKEIKVDVANDALDECCNERNGDKNLDATGVPLFLSTEGINNNSLKIIDGITPSILSSVFDVYGDLFNECCSKDGEFLGKLFDMYSSRCIKFMKQIRLQFETDGIDDYIETYILTKHPHTSKIISESVKHGADIKTILAKLHVKVLTEEEDEDPEKIKENKKTQDEFIRLISQYAVFLMHTGSIVNPTIETNVQNPFIEFIKTQVSEFSKLVSSEEISQKIIDEIIWEIPDPEKGAYNKGLQKIFTTNKPVKKSLRNFTRKLRTKLVDSQSKQNSNTTVNTNTNPTSNDATNTVSNTTSNNDATNPTSNDATNTTSNDSTNPANNNATNTTSNDSTNPANNNATNPASNNNASNDATNPISNAASNDNASNNVTKPPKSLEKAVDAYKNLGSLQNKANLFHEARKGNINFGNDRDGVKVNEIGSNIRDVNSVVKSFGF
jgi:hypothetical protein